MGLMIRNAIVVPIPGGFNMPTSRIKLNEPNTFFNQPPSNQTLLAKIGSDRIIDTIHIFDI